MTKEQKHDWRKVSPIHYVPDDDGDSPDWGCFDDESNAKVSAFVQSAQQRIGSGDLDRDELLSEMQEVLSGCNGGTDTIVKESVAIALSEAMEAAGLEPFGMDLYGW